MPMRRLGGVLGAVGDLLEDVVVRLHEEVHHASDTRATVLRRRGGSAANVVAAAVRAGGRARFIGQVGDDGVGGWLTDELRVLGAEVAGHRRGRTGTIVVLLDVHGERTMLSDRATATQLVEPDPAWMSGLSVLHVPFYSLAVEPLAATAHTLVEWAHDAGIPVSLDASSASVLTEFGVGRAVATMAALRPTLVLANELEAQVLGDGARPASLAGATVVVKQGAQPALVFVGDSAAAVVPAEHVAGVSDTTGAGDAFAAGLLLAWAAGADPVHAVREGHAVAAAAVRSVSSSSAAPN